MSTRQSSWEIILVGIVLTFLAIYFFFSSSTNSPHKITAIDTTHTLVVDLGNLSSLEKLDSLDHHNKLPKFKRVLVKLGRFSKIFNINDRNKHEFADAMPDIDRAVHHRHTTAGLTVDSIFSKNASVITTQHFDSKEIQNLDLHTDAGKIKITGSDVPAIKLVISSNKENVTPEEFNKNYSVSTRVDGNNLRVHIKARNHISSIFSLFGMNKTGSANISLYVPQNMNVTANSSAGQIVASHLTGDFEFSTSAGEIDLDSLSGTIHARTGMGKISTNHVSGKIQLNTSQGAVNMEHTTGAIVANTSAGAIHDEINLLKGDVDLSTSMGTIDVKVPGDMGCKIHLNGTSVSVNDGIHISGSISDKNVDGTLNGGGNYTIRASTSIGQITLSKN